MNEENLFKIQQSQLLTEIKKIQFIADNAEQIQKNLFSQVFEVNKKYLAQENRDPSQIFRGDDFRNWVDWYCTNQSK
jgi:hypothetical protein|tara:strand:- start:552 stop:782 length:231 start_codon:yes stop_codon:yes gene_type:complete